MVRHHILYLSRSKSILTAVSDNGLLPNTLDFIKPLPKLQNSTWGQSSYTVYHVWLHGCISLMQSFTTLLPIHWTCKLVHSVAGIRSHIWTGVLCPSVHSTSEWARFQKAAVPTNTVKLIMHKAVEKLQLCLIYFLRVAFSACWDCGMSYQQQNPFLQVSWRVLQQVQSENVHS